MMSGWLVCNWTGHNLLYEKGAIAESALESAEDAEGDAKADLNAANEQLRFSASIRIIRPVSSTSSRPSRA